MILRTKKNNENHIQLTEVGDQIVIRGITIRLVRTEKRVVKIFYFPKPKDRERKEGELYPLPFWPYATNDEERSRKAMKKYYPKWKR